MAIGLDTFKQAAAAGDGFLLQNEDAGAKTVKAFGSGVFGKLIAWIRDPGWDSNESLKKDFLASVTQKYPQLKLGGTDVAANAIGLNSGKPLSARVVRDLLALGEKTASRGETPALFANTAVPHSRYGSADEARSAAHSFLAEAELGAKGSALFKDLTAYTNKPGQNQPLLYSTIATKGPHAASFMKAMGGDADRRNGMEQAVKHPGVRANIEALQLADPVSYARYGNQRSIVEAAYATLAQIPTRLTDLSGVMTKAALDDKTTTLGHAGKEVLSVTATQLKKLDNDIAMLSDPRVLKGLPKDVAANLTALRDQLVEMHQEMENPKGPYQHFIAFAALAAGEPEEAMMILKAAMPPVAAAAAPVPSDMPTRPVPMPPSREPKPRVTAEGDVPAPSSMPTRPVPTPPPRLVTPPLIES